MRFSFDPLIAWLLAWALPPVIGATIGYVTNFVAIRMLFRPLERKWVLGIPVPWTPGVIPRQRGQLARGIARVVSRELLTPEAVRAQLQQPEFIQRFRVQLVALTQEVLSKPVRKLAGALTRARPEIERGLSMLLHQLFSSRGFIYALRGLVGRVLEIGSSRTLAEVAEDLTLAAFVQQRLIPRLADPAVGRQVGRAIREVANQPRATLGDFLSSAATESFAAMLREMMPSLMRELIGWLKRPAIRRELENRGRLLLYDVLGQLNLMQKLFVGAAQYDRTLRERMPEIVDDALRQLQRSANDPEVIAHVQEALGESLSTVGSRSLAELLPESVEQRVTELWGPLAEGPIASLIEVCLRSFLAEHAKTPVAELMARYLGVSMNDTLDAVSERLLRYLSDERTAISVAGQVVDTVGRLSDSGEITLSELLSIDAETKAALDDVAAEHVERLLMEQVPSMVAALDVERLVIDRIDALEVRDVERILLTVIASHLKWINLFGAVLGFLIGLTHIALRGVGAASANF